jgi:competence protein ComEA
MRGDWTSGPAKWGAAAVLGAACLGGIGWSVARGLTPWRGSSVAVAQAPTEGDQAGSPASGHRRAQAKVAVKVNINTADRAQLELLPGIGPALAERILQERKASGSFRRIEDLGRVKGIGPKIIERLRDQVIIEDPK